MINLDEDLSIKWIFSIGKNGVGWFWIKNWDRWLPSYMVASRKVRNICQKRKLKTCQQRSPESCPFIHRQRKITQLFMMSICCVEISLQWRLKYSIPRSPEWRRYKNGVTFMFLGTKFCLSDSLSIINLSPGNTS